MPGSSRYPPGERAVCHLIGRSLRWLERARSHLPCDRLVILAIFANAMTTHQPTDYHSLAEKIKRWGTELGFAQVGISDVDLRDEESRLQEWLANRYHGKMDYMARHGMMRARPAELLPGTLRVICVRMHYLPPTASFASTLKDGQLAYISRYALGRDYHKLMRSRLKQLGERIKALTPELGYRPFVDSAPILERPLAAKAGLGQVGKHSLLIHREHGSWFFLGELLVNLPLPVDTPKKEEKALCGKCVACMTICPTQAIIAPYVVDARRCISYLTIEYDGSIPEALRPLMGNRIYGCDDCQLACPWNRDAALTGEADFLPRADLHPASLLELFAWDETTFLKRTEGSSIRRIGYQQWQRNLAVALGNAPSSTQIIAALTARRTTASALVAEHIDWALARQRVQQAPNKQLDRLIRIVEKGLPRDA